MLSLDSIRAAHSRVRSGADFPAYVRDIRELGVASYVFHVDDGRTVYRAIDGSSLEAPARYPIEPIAEKGDAERLARDLRTHQAGGSDFLTACRQFAEAGVSYWIVDAVGLRCTYHDRSGVEMLAEEIPAA